MGLILTKNNNNVLYGVIEGYIEHNSEIASLQTDYTPGSKVTSAEDGSEYVLNLDHVWQKVGG